MKKLSLYTAVFLAFTASSCKKFLEQPPDNRAELHSPEQVSRLLGTAYPQSNYMGFFESASDNVADKGAGTIRNYNVDAYKFDDIRDDQQDSPEAYWQACYAAIAVANQALETCATAPDPDAYRAQKGEALLARAYAHFMLVTVFSETYNPTTAASDPGIPYVTEPEKVVFKNYERKTVAYVYEMIEKDLTAGLSLIDDKTYTVPRYHFNRAAANAFAARFYLFKRDYQKVVQHVNQVFPTNNASSMLRPWNTTYKNMTYQELFDTYARATEPANLLLVETVSWWARDYYNLRYSLTSGKRDEVLYYNVTGGQWSFENHVYTVGTDNYVIPKINEHFVRNNVNANIGLGYVVVPLFTAEEALLNRVEANTYLNNTTAAINDLNTYAATRINNYNATTHRITSAKIQGFYGTNLQTGLVLTVLDFKRAEFVQEGMRWLDILRYRIPVTHRTSEGEIFTLTGDDPRRLFQIPQSATIAGIEQNPR